MSRQERILITQNHQVDWEGHQFTGFHPGTYSAGGKKSRKAAAFFCIDQLNILLIVET